MGFDLEPLLPFPLLLLLGTGVPTAVTGIGLSLLPNFAEVLLLDWAWEKAGIATKAIVPIAALSQFRTIMPPSLR